MTDRPLAIAYQPIDTLTPRAGNPRTHSPAQIRQIAASIEQFGFTNPILVDDDNGVIAGHGRLAAAKLLGRCEVPTLRLSHMSEAQIRAYVIADNKLAENAGWDATLLGLELKYLTELDIAFDVTLTGFALPEIDLLIDNIDAAAPQTEDVVPAVATSPAVTQPGDVWLIGPHRLICGDATQAATYQTVMAGQRAQMVFSDPPYNVRIDGHVSGNGALTHREFPMACGEMSTEQFTAFLTAAFIQSVAHTIDGAIHFQCMDWRHLDEILQAGRAAYSELKNLCVWAKSNGGMGSLYRSQHELVLVFKAGRAPHINNIELGKHGRNRTNVWHYPGANSLGNTDLALHPTVKPVALIADAIRDCSHRNGIILDPFAGSGSTLVAADQTGRCGYGIELDAAYCDVIIKRMQTVCGLEAVLEPTGQTFEDRRRASEPATNCARTGA